MTVAPGSRLGPYEVVAPIGAGGMGEVWRGRDVRLDRSVAIKILPEGFAQNELLRARFEREAKTISSLNHPNICTLFDVGHESGSHYLVMELLEGESLADRISRGPLPLDQVLRFGSQIADALDRAHKQGIVHRDLKPGNVMITPTGAKLLDFGLARSGMESAAIRGLTEMPTQAKPLTQEGTILGTFQYMAPEQLEGLEADARTDIFALGALLYEMVTGRRAFEGHSRTSLIAAIVTAQPPPISTVAPMTPPALDHVVRKCLEKDRDDRWQSAHDVASELRWISEAGSQMGALAIPSVRSRRREHVAWVIAALAIVAAIASSVMLLRRREPVPRVVESELVIPVGWRMPGNGGLALSPDGETAAFVLTQVQGGKTSLWLRPLSSGTFRQLTGTEGAINPFWSPDSRKIGFFADGKLKTFDTEAGSLTVVCDAAQGGGGSWNRAGKILMTTGPGSPISIVNANGGTPAPLTRLQAGDKRHVLPFFLSDGNTFLFVARNEIPSKSTIKQASLEHPDEVRTVLASDDFVTFVEPDILVYDQQRRLVAQRYDAGKARTVGEPVSLANRFFFYSAVHGRLLLQRNQNLVLSQLVWVDRSGGEERTVAPPGFYFTPSISRDGRRLAVDISNAIDGNGDIWIYDVARNAATRVTYDEGNESAPRWSADGRTIIYYASTDASAGDIFDLPAGGTGKPQALVIDGREKRPTHVSRDGKWILFNSAGPSMDIGVWSADDKQARLWLATPFHEQCAQLSPDSKWIAYQSDESGRWEIYVRAFPDSDRKWLISAAGGTMPAWRGDGRELYYYSLEGRMMAVSVTPGAEFESAVPVALFETPLRQHITSQYDVTADGKRFLINKRVESSAVEPIVLIQNWDSKLASR